MEKPQKSITAKLQVNLHSNQRKKKNIYKYIKIYKKYIKIYKNI